MAPSKEFAPAPANTEMTVRKPDTVARPGAPLIPAVEQVQAGLMESVLIGGDLAPLKPTERLQYYRSVCASLGLNPLTKPFEYLSLSGKLTLYARKDCTDQLRKLNNISAKFDEPKILDGMLYVKAHVSTPDGRTDEATGVIAIETLKGEAKANAFMKCETKAKRRATLSICGLGFTDESELATMPGARVVSVDEAHTQQALAPPTTPAPAVAKAKSTPPATPAPARPHQGAFGADPNDPPELKETLQRYTGATMATRLVMFQQLKTGLRAQTETDDTYYEILLGFAVDGHPVEHANQFKKLEDQQKCIRLLWITLANMMQPQE